MRRDAMSRLSASVFALVIVLSTLVIPMGDAEAETLGTNTIYVPVTSNGSPVSTGVTVTLTNVHTGTVLVAAYSSAMKLYVVNDAPSGYYRVDVVDYVVVGGEIQYTDKYYDSIGEREFPFSGLTSYTVMPQIALDDFNAKQWEWNVTVRDTDNFPVDDAVVGFYSLSAKEMVSRATTDSEGVAVVKMFNSAAPDFALTIICDEYETYAERTSVTSDSVLTVNLNESIHITGLMTNYLGKPAENVVGYLLSTNPDQPWIKRLLKSEEGAWLRFDAYSDVFTLCVDADGATAEIFTLDLTNETDYKPGDVLDLSMMLSNQTQTMDSFEMVFGSDYDSFTLTESNEWNYDDAFPGLDYNDIGSLRMQIDLNFDSQPDGVVDITEVSDFYNKIQGYGPKHITSSGLLTVNDTIYTAGAIPPITLTLAPGTVDNTTSVSYSYTCTYTSVEDIDDGADDYTAVLYAAYDTPSSNRTFAVTLPAGYELVYNSSGDESSRVTVYGYETFVVDPEIYIGGPEPVSLAFELSEGPSAGAAVEIEQGLVFAIKDDEGNITGFIVRVGSNVTFSAMDSYDPNKNPMLYTWCFGDGSENVTTSNDTVQHNYTMAAANYTVNLTVVDAVGFVNWTEIQVIADDMDPVPVITIKDLEANETTGVLEIDQGQAVSFNATSSSDDAVSSGDSLGTIDFFEFDFGDGNESDRMYWSDDEKNVTHSFAESGTYDVVLNVTDVVGHWKNTTLTVKVNDSAAPTVTFVVKNATYGTSLIENTTLVFDANATTDNLDDKEDMYFSWYFADDLGEESWLNGTGLWNVTHVYQMVGVISVELNVTDTSNNSASIKRSVKIESSARPNVVFDGPLYFEPAEFTEGEVGVIIINVTNKGSAVATDVVVTIYIVGEDADTLIGTTSQLWNGTQPVAQIGIGETVQLRFEWTPSKQGTYKLKLNVTSSGQLLTDSFTARADEELVVNEAPWKKIALWGGIAAVIILVPLLLYLRGRWSRRERKGPRRDKDRFDKAELKERKEREKRERKEKRKKEKEKEQREKERKEKS